MGTAVLYGAVMLAVLVAAAVRKDRRGDWQYLALVVASVLVVELVATYFFWVGSIIRFPADSLLWSESEFVGDIIKLRVGYPLYTAPANLESFNYPPATQFLTFTLSKLLGNSTSIPLFRAIQLGFAVLAAFVSFLSMRSLLQLTATSPRRFPVLWGALGFSFLLLIGSNRITNGFVHYLHDDALALLVSAVGYWLLIQYIQHRKVGTLACMALLPAAGFLVKQSLLIWIVLYGGFLLVFDAPRSWRRVLGFLLGAGAAALGTIGACYLLWGHDFIYWVFTMLGHHTVSPLRSFDHALTVWPYFFSAIAAGLLLLGPRPDRRVLGAFVVVLALLTMETYTSGVAWMLNHIGPGSLLVGIWVVAALVHAFPRIVPAPDQQGVSLGGLRSASAVVLLLLLLSGLFAVRIPQPGVPPDATRYLADIERSVAGVPRERLLIDMGSWLYLKQGIVMKDRGAPAGEGGYTGTADFSGMLARIRARRYDRILLRDFHEASFQYDYAGWEKSSGVRAALLENYHETATIPGVSGGERQPAWFAPISVLAPNGR